MTNDMLLRRYNRDKTWKLFAAVVIDLIGFISYLIPGIAEVLDVLWGPLSAILIFILFKKRKNIALAGAIFGGIEELSPGFDFIPTATLVWVDVYIIEKEKTLSKYMENHIREEEIVSNFHNKLENK